MGVSFLGGRGLAISESILAVVSGFSPGSPDAPRHPLVEARLRRGWSQNKLAYLLQGFGLGTTRKSVTRWERDVVPDAVAQHALGELFEVEPAIRARLPWPRWLPTGEVPGLRQPWDHTGTVDALCEVAVRTPLERRNFLVLVGADLLLPAYMWQANPGPWLARGEGGKHVGSALMDEIEKLIPARQRMDDERGGGALLDALNADLRFVTDILKDGTYERGIETRLYRATAQIARLAGWAAFDGGQHAAAQQYYLAALRAANMIGDHTQAANVVGEMGMHAYETGHPTDATKLLDVATSAAQRTPALVQALIWSNAGRAQASAGNSTEARKAFDRSADHLDRSSGDGDSPSWLYWFEENGESRLRSQLGRGLFDLGDYAGAERELTNVTRNLGHRYPRDRARYEAYVAISQLRTGDVDQACDSGRRTVDLLADQVNSQHARELLQTFEKELPSANATVREFREYARMRLAA